MPAIREITNANDIINKYVTGFPVGKLLKENGISDCLFRRLLRDAGVKTRERILPKKPVKSELDISIVKAYESGESENEIAKRLGKSRSTIARIITGNGVKRRTQSEAETLKWVKIKSNAGGIERQCSAAWKAADDRDSEREAAVVGAYSSVENGGKAKIANKIGCSRSEVSRILKKNNLLKGIHDSDTKSRRANGVMISANEGVTSSAMISDYEYKLLDEMSRHGLKPVHQFALCSRNVDFAFPEINVAVELERRPIADSKSMARERLELFFDAGWRVIIIYDCQRLGIDYAAVTEKLISCLDLIGGNPSTPGQYGVIRRDGQRSSARSKYLNGFSRIEGF